MQTSINPADQQRLLTQSEVAEILNVQQSTLESWRTDARRGSLPYLKVGRLIRYRPEDLAAFIEASRRGCDDERGNA